MLTNTLVKSACVQAERLYRSVLGELRAQGIGGVLINGVFRDLNE